MRRLSVAALGIAVLAAPVEGNEPFTWSAGFEGLCVPPRSAPTYVAFTGAYAQVDGTVADVEGAFPAVVDGKPRNSVRLALRPPGLELTLLEARTLLLRWPPGYHGLTFEPSDLEGMGPVVTDKVTVYWSPVRGRAGLGGRAYYSLDCVFDLTMDKPIDVTATATLNFVATYGEEPDAIQVWGDEHGIQDRHIEETRASPTIPVLPATWGRIKAHYH